MAMKFNFHSERVTDTVKDLVIAFNELVEKSREGKFDAEANLTFSESLGKYCVEATGREWTGIDMLRNPQITTHDSRFTQTFAAVLAEALVPAIPNVVSEEYTNFFDVQQIGWGDTARYEIESNDTFVVYDI